MNSLKPLLSNNQVLLRTALRGFQASASGHQQQQNYQYKYSYAVPLVAASLYAIHQSQQDNPSLCDGPSTADRIRGNYENKIRFFSPPEKIFETFSTEKNEDN